MTEPREDRIVAEGVHKAFGENEVLKGVLFSVAQGSATAIIGPSGSGKTTLLRALNALDVPDAGVIRVGEVERRAAIERRIVLVTLGRLLEHRHGRGVRCQRRTSNRFCFVRKTPPC